MKVLALYDIHGNVHALEAVLADSRAADPDAVVIGGDAVPGPFAGAALDRLASLSVPVEWVRSDGEREVAAAVGAPEPEPGDWAAITGAITAAELDDERALALGDLPLTVELDGVLYCHASPRRDDELLTRLSPHERWEDALAGVDARLVVGGHTHQQDDRAVGAARFVNAGSVGLPYEGDGAARWLWVADGEPELRSTACVVALDSQLPCALRVGERPAVPEHRGESGRVGVDRRVGLIGASAGDVDDVV